ncbi:MAG: hypothetical protein GEV11_22905, partial [Streptosporangiales bacterium]|nr:hypothetical protein [Streptosporangiales bacterium]
SPYPSPADPGQELRRGRNRVAPALRDDDDAPVNSAGQDGRDTPSEALRRDPDYRLLFGAVAVSQAGSQITPVALPLTQPGWGVLFFAVGGFGLIAFSMIYNVAQITYRQTVTPQHMLGRMNATIRFVVWGVVPVGALAGGVIAELAGLRTAMWIAAAGEALAAVPPLLSPLRRMRDLEPSPPPERTGEADDPAGAAD